MTTNNAIASMALFSQLYDNNKNIYSLIYEFIKIAVAVQRVYSANSAEIVRYVKEYYGFDMPESLFKTALAQATRDSTEVRYDKLKKLYFFDLAAINIADKLKEHEDLKQSYNYIFIELTKFIEERTKSRVDINTVASELADVLLDKPNAGMYTEFILKYIVDLEPQKKEQLNNILAGLIIYEGVVYTPNISDIKNWSQNLILFFSTEHIFHYFGLNGQIYRKYLEDFMALVEEINQNKRRITIKYFSETKNEIDGYFSAAANLLKNKAGYVEDAAMQAIINGCETQSDIIKKKTDLFVFLQAHGIQEDEATYKYIAEENEVYNILSQRLIDNIFADPVFKEYPKNDIRIEKLLKQLNKINILRRGRNIGPIENSGFLFVSESNLTPKLEKFLKDEKDFRHFSNLGSLLNHLWLKLNKGFLYNNERPAMFDVAIKARMALSSKLVQAVKNKYSKIKSSKEEITPECILELKKFNVTPDGIDDISIDDITSFLTMDIVEFAQKEKEMLNEKVSKGVCASRELCTIRKKEMDKVICKSRKACVRRTLLLYILCWSIPVAILISITTLLIYICSLLNFSFPYMLDKIISYGISFSGVILLIKFYHKRTKKWIQKKIIGFYKGCIYDTYCDYYEAATKLKDLVK